MHITSYHDTIPTARNAALGALRASLRLRLVVQTGACRLAMFPESLCVFRATIRACLNLRSVEERSRNNCKVGAPRRGFLDAVFEHGLAYARSQEFYDTARFWQWMRFPGDVVFAARALLMAWDFLLKLRPLLPAVLERTFAAKLVPQQSAVLVRTA